MSAVEALKAARAAGISVDLDGDNLALQAPAPPPPSVIELLKRHKADIVALLQPKSDGWSAADWQTRFGELAGRFEFDGDMARPDAEASAFEACIVKWLNRNPVSSPAGRCAWCDRRESESAMVLPFGVEPTHTWLHGECWQPWHEARRAEAVKALGRIGIFPDAENSLAMVERSTKPPTD